MIDVKQIFDKFSNANFFSRINNLHPLEIHLGLDEKGRKAIELRAPFSPRKVIGTAAIAVNQYRKENYNTIRFSLCNEEISGLFYKFCEDLIEETADTKCAADGYMIIVNRFFQWKKLFVPSKGNLLSEAEIMGLIAEILFLKLTLIPKFGSAYAIQSWSGQELTHKDFSFDDTWVEIKAIKSGKPTVRISSLEQLESEYVGQLVVYLLEKMSTAYYGITLNRLILETRNIITTADLQDQFMSKVALQGYEYNNYYDDFVYEISDVKRYQVLDGFPRLTAQCVNPAIKMVTYEISLSDISQFEISD